MKLFLILFIQVLLSSPLLAVNVKDYGAMGDGKTDDTRAIMKAVSALQVLSTNGFNNGYKPSVYIGGSEDLYFPFGSYLISSSIKLGHYVRVRGENAILTTFSGKNELTAFNLIGWHCDISGIQFANFKVAVSIDTKNLDTGQITIRDCKFVDNAVAISLNAQSSITNITESNFYGNKIALDIIHGDKVFLNKCWITSGRLSGQNPAQIINRAVFHMDDVLLVPAVNLKNTIEAAWINNYGTVSCNLVRQGGEPGAMCLINNFSEAKLKYPIIPSSITVMNTDSYAADENDGKFFTPAAIRLFAIPNQIYLQNIRGMVDAYLINFTRDTKTTWSKKLMDYPKSSEFIKITVADIVGGRKFDNKLYLPDNLLPYIAADKELNTKAAQNHDKKPKVGNRSNSPNQINSFLQEVSINDIYANYLINYHGNPNVQGSGNYHGGFVGVFRINGIYQKGKVSHQLVLTEAFNKVGNKEANEKDFEVDFYWKVNGSKIKDADVLDYTVVFHFKSSTAAETFNLINLDLLK
ncbi:MAG: glycosyl hydrolase family 28-related protein [Saprospiraceae bacterium]